MKNKYTDQIGALGIDECWLDVTGSRRIYGTGEKITNELRNRVKSELGLTVSVGVSFNKNFAKLGSDMKKPDAVTVIPWGSFREIIWELPVSDLFGVGAKTARKLAERGVYTIGRLAQTPESVVRSWFGVGQNFGCLPMGWIFTQFLIGIMNLRSSRSVTALRCRMI